VTRIGPAPDCHLSAAYARPVPEPDPRPDGRPDDPDDGPDDGPDEGRVDERAPYDPMPHGPAEVGVGPWVGERPSGPGSEVYDEQLLAAGDRRNVVDRYRYWSVPAIVADLDTRRHDFHVAIENWQHDFNIGTIVRTANAFLAREVHVVGNRRWNRRGAMVTDRYQHVRHHPDVPSLAAELRADGVVLLGIDNLPGSTALETLDLPRRVCLLFGQEGPGLSEAARDACDGTFSIAQFGSTRSINASAAAAIAMHAWVRQHADLSGSWRG
jgi:tRNA(Leu) C34 or U34 (ribose-2'-O)-methylase TrmL